MEAWYPFAKAAFLTLLGHYSLALSAYPMLLYFSSIQIPSDFTACCLNFFSFCLPVKPSVLIVVPLGGSYVIPELRLICIKPHILH